MCVLHPAVLCLYSASKHRIHAQLYTPGQPTQLQLMAHTCTGNESDAPWAANSSIFSMLQEAGPLASKSAAPADQPKASLCSAMQLCVRTLAQSHDFHPFDCWHPRCCCGGASCHLPLQRLSLRPGCVQERHSKSKHKPEKASKEAKVKKVSKFKFKS